MRSVFYSSLQGFTESVWLYRSKFDLDFELGKGLDEYSTIYDKFSLLHTNLLSNSLLSTILKF